MAGGVAPFTCGPIENAMSFTFALLYDDMRELCNVVGQESAHAFGLDHELQCDDPLTYLPGCPIKRFQDLDAPCGEFSERDCDCGGDTQNSYQYLLEFLGEGLVPDVLIRAPLAEAQVPVGFSVEATGNDDIEITYGELWIDDQFIELRESSPFLFSAPKTLPPGPHSVEVRIFDDRDQYGSQSIDVEQLACEGNSECGFAHICVDGLCLLGPGNSDGLGAECTDNDGCQNGLCATDYGSEPGTAGVCTARCATDALACPTGFDCVDGRGGERLCIVRNVGSGGFCSSGANGRGAGMGMAALLMALWAARRRRSS